MAKSKTKKKKNIKIILIIFAILILLTLYLQGHTSYILNTNDVSYTNFFHYLLESIIKNPFNCFHYNVYALMWWLVWLVIFAFWLSQINKPKADEKWRNIEHGSNDFQNDTEIDTFLEEKTDEIVPFTDEEKHNIMKILNITEEKEE